jgi:hypothetical protein
MTNVMDLRGEARLLELELNATILAQVINLLILILFFAGIIILIVQVLSSKKNFSNRIEKVESELTEIRRLLEKNKGNKG